MLRNLILPAAVMCFSVQAQAAGDVTEKRLLNPADEGRNWLVKGGNAQGQHYSALDQINAGNVAGLGLAWAADIPAPDGIATTPIIVDGLLYLSAAYSIVYAVDASNGRILWTYDPVVRASFNDDPGLSWVARAHRGIAVWDGRVYVTTADCRLIALAAATGRQDWSRQTCDTDKGYAISDSPYVGGGKVFVGNAGSESGEKNRGYVSAYDAESGTLAWRFYTVPSDNPAENDTPALIMAAATWSGDALEKFGGGGSAWNEMTYDPESGLLYFGTGGGLPYAYDVRSPNGGDNLFLSSVIAVDANSGEYRWHYQTVPEDSWEYNATMNIALVDVRHNGQPRDALVIAPKNGFHYLLDRRSGELLAADKIAKVNWASHINLETGRPVYTTQAEYWRMSPGEEIAVWPNMWGAHSWQPMAWHPGLNLSYIPVADIPSLVRDYDDGDFTDRMELVTEADAKPISPGKLVAFDPQNGKARWTVEHELPFNGGVMATAGNLVFQGDAFGVFSSYRADTGEKLWSVQTGTSINAAPASFAIGDTQYVVIPVGAGGGLQFVYPDLHATPATTGPTRLLAFSLGSDAELHTVAAPQRPLPDPPSFKASTETLAVGADIYSYTCGSCHGTNAIARPGGSVPDLRYTSRQVHAQWRDIVINGARRANGMPAFDLSEHEVEAIHAYVLSRAKALVE